MTYEVRKSAYPFLCRGYTAGGESWWRFDADGWVHCCDHKGPWVCVGPEQVPAEVRRLRRAHAAGEITIWQVCVEGDWRYATPDVAAGVHVLRPGNVRLVTIPAPTRYRWARRPRSFLRPRGVTPKRLAAAARHLEREREDLGLFAVQVAQEQETPVERIDSFDQGMIAGERGDRRLTARWWREARAILRAADPHERAMVLARWNAGYYPADAAMFLSFISNLLLRS